MKEEEIIEGNKLIAEILGATSEVRGVGEKTDKYYYEMTGVNFAKYQKGKDTTHCFPIPHRIMSFTSWGHDSLDGKKKVGAFCVLSKLEFHSSWDWLMPAWKKVIEVIGIWMSCHAKIEYSKYWLEASEKIGQAITSVDINSAHSRITNLIKWYNANKK